MSSDSCPELVDHALSVDLAAPHKCGAGVVQLNLIDYLVGAGHIIIHTHSPVISGEPTPLVADRTFRGGTLTHPGQILPGCLARIMLPDMGEDNLAHNQYLNSHI
jgi:hypothetical protein